MITSLWWCELRLGRALSGLSGRGEEELRLCVTRGPCRRTRGPASRNAGCSRLAGGFQQRPHRGTGPFTEPLGRAGTVGSSCSVCFCLGFQLSSHGAPLPFGKNSLSCEQWWRRDPGSCSCGSQSSVSVCWMLHSGTWTPGAWTPGAWESDPNMQELGRDDCRLVAQDSHQHLGRGPAAAPTGYCSDSSAAFVDTSLSFCPFCKNGL